MLYSPTKNTLSHAMKSLQNGYYSGDQVGNNTPRKNIFSKVQIHSQDTMKSYGVKMAILNFGKQETKPIVGNQCN